ncbi:hypothetical protein [Paractinoplanes bogorensis]|uniref:hypothetical protein n=1 Tax=Paractinoplanes bogorensis TaxID=1610840 RepID=UPI0027E0A18E|nr:hypothetical protein [Actinoplanes bogorensis]
MLDASAVVELLQGHPMMMTMLADALAGWINMLLPASAIAEAQAAVRLPASTWDHILRLHGTVVLDLTGRNALEVGIFASPRLEHHPVQPLLTGPLMAGHVLQEAVETKAVIFTRIPELYGGHDVAVRAI